MATLSLDVVILVRSDTKSTPRVRSFRERVRGALLCVRDACADRCAFEPALSMSTAAFQLERLISQKQMCSDAPTAFRMRLDASSSRGKDRLCARLMRARA